MRALEPDVQGRVEVDGVGIGYEVFGSGDRTVVLTPAWALVCSRFWKAQVPYLARRFRVVTWDAPGSGRSDRPEDPRHYGRDVRDGLAVLDATGTERALMVGLSIGAATSLFTAAQHPERVAGVVAIGPTIPHLVDDHPWRDDRLRGRPRRRRLAPLLPRLVAPRLPRLRRALRARDAARAAFGEAGRRLHRLGARRRPRGARVHDGRASGLRDARAGRGAGLRRALPGARHPRRRRPHHAAGLRAARRRAHAAATSSSSRAPATRRRRATRSRSTSCSTPSRSASSAPRGSPSAAGGARSRAAPSGRCSSPPRSGSATRGAT